MKRYLLFSGFDYYPRGGWNDFNGSFDSIEKAKQKWDQIKRKHMWSHIVDSETEEKITL